MGNGLLTLGYGPFEFLWFSGPVVAFIESVCYYILSFRVVIMVGSSSIGSLYNPSTVVSCK